jgi:nucleoside-diphosphate-sugar epimerase
MVFLTGGSGFLGSYFLYYLLRDNKQVRALKRRTSDLKYTRLIFKYLSEFEPLPDDETWERALGRVQWVEGDILDMNSLLDAFEGVDTVYDTAAVVSYDHKLRNKILTTNINGAANIVNACIAKSVKKLAYVSSVAALGREPGVVIKETDKTEKLHFNNAYAESKYRAEMEVWRGMGEGLDVFVICPGIILGWGNFSWSSPEIFKTVYEGLKFYPTGSNAFVDARDVAKALITLSNNPEAANMKFIASSETVVYKNIFDMVGEGLRMKPPSIKVNSALVKLVWIYAEIKAFLTGGTPFVTNDMATTASKDYYYDNSRLKDEFHYPFMPVSQTIADTCKVFLDTLNK